MSVSDEESSSWIVHLLSKPQSQFLCAVERGYIEDGFNLYGLKATVANYTASLDTILDRGSSSDGSDAGAPSKANYGALELYGLVHARYIVTAHGLESMHQKYLRQDFGRCPRYYCQNHPGKGAAAEEPPRRFAAEPYKRRPMGLHDAVGVDVVQTFCPRCGEVYRCGGGRGRGGPDGAFFGTTFAQLFLMTYGFPRPRPADEVFVPRVFGFRVHATAPDHVPEAPGRRQAPPPAPAAPPRPLAATTKRRREDDVGDDDDVIIVGTSPAPGGRPPGHPPPMPGRAAPQPCAAPHVNGKD